MIAISYAMSLLLQGSHEKVIATGAVTIQAADQDSSGISILSLTNNALNETRNIQVTSLLVAFDGVTGFQIKKSSIDALVGPVIITVTNTVLSTEAVFTITP
jgi:hypothetical protein